MNILLAAAELSPLAKAGGLADVVASLPVEWKKQGHNPIVIIPKYSLIDPYKYGFEPTDMVLYVPVSNWLEYARLWRGTLPGTDVPCYLVENNDYFWRDGIYGNPNEYKDNDRRFIFFSRAVMEAAKALNFKPDIIHAHDYHTAFVMAFLKTHYRYDPLFSQSAGVFTIHNLGYQGWFDPKRAMDFAGFGSHHFYPGSWFEKNGAINAMKAGIMFADKITTVSPTYSKEIRWDYYGEGLQHELNERGADLIGVLNGADYSEWNPENDKLIYKNYSVKSLQDKMKNKLAFLKEMGVSENNDIDKPLIGMVTRLTGQKGVDLLMNKLEHHLFHTNYRFAILGSGEQVYVEYFNYLAWKYPGRIYVYIGYSNEIAHKIICSSDFLFLPSRYEPCGLTQMYALRYGTIPIVRSTGGLADTVFEYTQENKNGNGFLFINYNAEDMDFAISRAIQVYYNKDDWQRLQENAMNCDYSVSKAATKYIEVFNWALEKIRSFNA